MQRWNHLLHTARFDRSMMWHAWNTELLSPVYVLWLEDCLVWQIFSYFTQKVVVKFLNTLLSISFHTIMYSFWLLLVCKEVRVHNWARILETGFLNQLVKLYISTFMGKQIFTLLITNSSLSSLDVSPTVFICWLSPSISSFSMNGRFLQWGSPDYLNFFNNIRKSAV